MMSYLDAKELSQLLLDLAEELDADSVPITAI